MYTVEYCKDNLFRPGATFSRTSFEFTLRAGSWPEGTIFRGAGRRIIIHNGEAVELQEGQDHKLPSKAMLQSRRRTRKSRRRTRR